VEIVKNSYDADAERVQITFKNLRSASPSIEILDDGTGMDSTTLVERWMHIGDSSKTQLEKSPGKGRVLTGEKGLGRLGLDRLARNTSLRSFVAGSQSGVEIAIDWTLYEVEASDIGAIKHPIFSVPKASEELLAPRPSVPLQGTKLVLSDLRDTWASPVEGKWDYSYIATLRRELSLLLSPLSGVKDFAIFIYIDGDKSDESSENEVCGQVTPDSIAKGAEWTVTATLSKNGVISLRAHSDMLGVDRRKRQNWGAAFRGQSKPQCGPLRFEMYFFRKSKSSDVGISSAHINQFLKENQGIRIYRDGFRVRPYGAPDGDGDWLNLSFRRQSRNQTVYDPQWKVGYKQIVGALFIGRLKNPALIDQANREGLVEVGEYLEARRFALYAIEFFESEITQHYIRLRATNESEKSTLEAIATESDQLDTTATETIRRLGTEVETLLSMAGGPTVDWELKKSTIEDLLAEAKQTAEDASLAHKRLIKASDAQRSELEKQKNTLANLASLGILAAAFGHETIASTNAVIANAGLLKLYLSDIILATPELVERVERSTSIVVKESQKIDTFARFALRNVGRDKRTRTKIFLNKIAREVLDAFDNRFKLQNIKVEVRCESIPAILGFRIDWESIVVNFITNAIWALEDTPAEARRIALTMAQKGDQISILFSDTGRGLEPGTEERIFEPTVSTRRNQRGDVVGTGMGLAIIKSFVDAHDGSIVARNSASGGAEFHTLLPIPKLSSRGPRRKGKQ